jgi:hypothetical protein
MEMLWPLDEGAAYLVYRALWTNVRDAEDVEALGGIDSLAQRFLPHHACAG